MKIRSRPLRQLRLRLSRCGHAAAIACLAALGAPARPAVVPGDATRALPPAAVARALALAIEAASAVAPPQAEVIAEPGRLDPRLTLAPCAKVQAYLPAGVPAWGTTRVGLRCTEGAVAWRVFLPVTVQVWASGVVSAGALPTGARLTATQLGVARIDWAAAGGGFSEPAQLEGRTLSRPLSPGQALHPSDLQARQWFDFGETVRVVLHGEGFSVSTEGQALTRGMDGQSARVRTATGQVIVGRAVADHQIEVTM